MSDDGRTTGLIRQLGSKDWEAASEAQRSLVRIGKPAVLLLCEALEGRNASVAWRAAWVLGRVWDRRAVEPLCRVLRTAYADPPFARAARTEAASRALRDQQALLRAEVTDALRLLRDPASVEALCDALEDGYFNVRKNAAKALGEIGAPAAPELAARLTRLPPDSAISAAALLGSAGDERCIAPLCELLAQGQFPVRLAAANSLGQLARRCRAPELRAAIPELKRLASPWRPVPDVLQERCAATLRLIETATAGIQSVPRPAGAPHATSSHLPRPADASDPDRFTLPPLPELEREPVAAPAGSPLLRRLRSLLRGGDAE
ncbi:MAG: HEAT repeat domain-containing protein [Actinomycetota bacterium]